MWNKTASEIESRRMRLVDFRVIGKTFELNESAGFHILKEITMKSCLKRSLTLFSPVQLRIRPVLKNIFRENVKIGSLSIF